MSNFEVVSKNNATILAQLVMSKQATAFIKAKCETGSSFFRDGGSSQAYATSDIDFTKVTAGDKLVNEWHTLWRDSDNPDYYAMVTSVEGVVAKSQQEYGKIVVETEDGLSWEEYDSISINEVQPPHWCFYPDYAEALEREKALGAMGEDYSEGMLRLLTKKQKMALGCKSYIL